MNSFTFKESVVLPFSCTKYSNETYAETSCEEENPFVCVVGKGWITHFFYLFVLDYIGKKVFHLFRAVLIRPWTLGST